ncbi:MAG: DUF2520 domain-containing protein [Tannerellaceae bacterium]
MKVVLIGAGNVATRLSLRMQQVGMEVVQVYSHTASSAELLSGRLNCAWTTELAELTSEADLYLISVKDAVLAEVIGQLKPNRALWVHTAGSMPMDLFEGQMERYGVLYPLQTFSKERAVRMEGIPFFVEAHTPEDVAVLCQVAEALSGNVQLLSSEKRRTLHLAAVFACNFTNHMYALAGKLLAEEGIPADSLLPLIDETAAKIHQLSPAEAQTGPAIRYDKNVINKQLAMLTDPDMKSVYQLLSQSIHKEATQNE